MDNTWMSYRGGGRDAAHRFSFARILLNRLSHRAHGGRDLADDDIGVRTSQRGWANPILPPSIVTHP